MKDIVKNSLDEAVKTLAEFVSNGACIDALACAGEMMACAVKNGGKIIACGNGGSLCDATHFAEELTARFRGNRRPIPAIAINDPAYLTCALNDFDPLDIFARYV